MRKLLFTLCLSPVRPRRLLIVDAVDVGREPGEWFEIDPSEIPAIKLDDFSMHQVPTSNLLRELRTRPASKSGCWSARPGRCRRKSPRGFRNRSNAPYGRLPNGSPANISES